MHGSDFSLSGLAAEEQPDGPAEEFENEELARVADDDLGVVLRLFGVVIDSEVDFCLFFERARTCLAFFTLSSAFFFPLFLLSFPGCLPLIFLLLLFSLSFFSFFKNVCTFSTSQDPSTGHLFCR